MKEIELLLKRLGASYDQLLDCEGIISEFSYKDAERHLRGIIENVLFEKEIQEEQAKKRH